MEDGFPLFDPNNEAERQEQKLREYYEEFSANARKRLLAKIVVRPTSVYDILYPQTRVLLLAKNVPINNDLEENAKIIRDRLIAKIVTEETDLEKISADFRNSLLARAKIQEDKFKLVRNADAYRKNNLSKNAPKDTDLESDSAFARTNNVSKNRPNLSLQGDGDIDTNSEAYKVNNISKNVSKDQDLLRDSEDFRIGDVHKNVPKKTDIESASQAYRENNLSKNADGPKTIDEIAESQRNLQLAKNSSKPSDIAEDSESFRTGDLSKNSTKEQDLLRDSEDIRNKFRKNDINKNVPNKSDIESDAMAFRKNNLSKNKVAPSNTDADSDIYRTNNLANNKSGGLSIDDTAESKRSDSLSANKPKSTDLEADSAQFRADDLSANISDNSNIEKDSAQFRADDLSANKPKTTDLEADSAQFRADDLSANKLKATDLESDSIPFRKDDLSFNKPNFTNLEVDSAQFRADDLSVNKSKATNLESDSIPFRNDDLSANKPKFTDLESDSVSFRSDDLSFNKPKITDLEADSVIFRSDDLSFNTPNFTNLETDSVPFRVDDLAANTPNITDLETDSVQFRADDLAANTPNITDLETDSTPFLYNNLSSNVPSTSDLEVDSVPFRNDDLAANVLSTSNLFNDSAPFRNDDLAANVPNSSNLAVDSVPFRALGLAANVPINSNIASDSISFRDDLLSSNVPYNTDLLTDSGTYRADAKAKNEIYGLLGINIQGAGTSAFLGISRVFTQGILVRQLLLSKNKPKGSPLGGTFIRLDDKIERWSTGAAGSSNDFLKENLVKNYYVPQGAGVGPSNEYTSSSGELLDGSRDVNTRFAYRAGFGAGGDNLSPLAPTQRGIMAQVNFFANQQSLIQESYGNTPVNSFGIGSIPINISDKYFYVDALSPKGGGFDAALNSAEATINYSEGFVTKNIRLYNIARNSYNIRGVQVGDPEALSSLQGFDAPDFQALIASTIGSFNFSQSVGTQAGTNSTPISIVTKNEGQYIKGAGDSDMLKPGADTTLGSADSMMAKTAIGNPYEDEDFLLGKRGVRHIVNTIKASDNPMAGNFDPQNNKAYIIGTQRDGTARVARQRYTIANPYAPGRAGKLLFSIKNYSSGEQFFFPPYIDSIQNTENASWNSVSFLGRPEAMYTYNNSERTASISFFVLTDYSESVDIGRNWGSDSMDKVTATFSRHFTDSNVSQNASKKLEQQELRKIKKEQQDALSENSKKQEELNSNSNDVGEDGKEVDNSEQVAAKKSAQDKKEAEERKKAKSAASAELTAEAGRLKAEAAKTVEAIGASELVGNTRTNYSESNITSGNIYNLDMTKLERNGDEIICKPEDSIKRINTMKKGLMFQPAFFSGDKVDFVRKVEFLSKLTRPSAAPEKPNTGFSFTKPPISHIKLGDWWDHDIVVDSVSYDYADAPWTLDGGNVQPMWVKVSISFKIIGPYGSATSRPPLSTDKGGMYSPMR